LTEVDNFHTKESGSLTNITPISRRHKCIYEFHLVPINRCVKLIFIGVIDKTFATVTYFRYDILYNERYYSANGEIPRQVSSQT
jgi:hypothetical protein